MLEKHRSRHLDDPIWGCEAISQVAGLFKADGTVDIRKGYYLIERGMIDATKVRGTDGKGGLLVSTRHRVLRSLGILVGDGVPNSAEQRLSPGVSGSSTKDAV